MDADGNYFIDNGIRKYTVIRIKNSTTSDFYSFKIKGVVRILPRFKTVRKRTRFGVVNIPLNVRRFEWHMRRSELIDSGHHLVISSRQNEALMRKVVEFREWAFKRDATLMLASDTLLAWLTGCDILCNSNSAIDFSFFIEEYYNGFIYDLWRVPFMELKTRLNTPGNLLKLRAMVLEKVDVHIFFLYHNSTTSWIGGLMEGWNLAYKLEYPLVDRACTAVFLGQLMYVPCNAYQYADAQYGHKWRNLRACKAHLWNGSPMNMRMLEAYSKRIPVSAYFKAYD